MAEENASPISAAKPPVANPIISAPSTHAATLKLKPVIRKPTVGGVAARPGIKLPTAVKPAAPVEPVPASTEAPAATSPMDQLRSATQKLKGLTQQIPQQAILHKTGIIAEQALTEAQKQASKSRTARISLSDAIGVAPVKNEAAPMKTIRIKRPVDMTPPSPAAAPVAAPAVAPAAEPTPAPEAPAPAAEEATVTQRKTLKIARPGGVRPTGKFGVKKPAAVAAPAEAAGEGDGADIPDVQDIPEMPAVAAMPTASVVPADAIPDVGKTCQFLGLIVQIASCVAMGFLAWKLYQVTLLPAYCGGTVM